NMGILRMKSASPVLKPVDIYNIAVQSFNFQSYAIPNTGGIWFRNNLLEIQLLNRLSDRIPGQLYGNING
ncbi:hypothetical protein J6590_102004, partial [Homalodisca vitripennis]